MFSVEKPWIQRDKRTVQSLYKSVGTEGRKIINSNNPHVGIDNLTALDFWGLMESANGRQRTITFAYDSLSNKTILWRINRDFYG